ncbi:phage tail protein [Halostella sp. PRR32]|uniref:phage tail protein n=1 Tax=Halostella sp. PRR32 TaxID=3098147 RepID=UPI00110E9B42|nr:phage tail protein [Halostella sp. PRR32]
MADTHGPLKQTEFKVELDGVNVPGFIEVELPAKRTKEIEYREGNDPGHNRKLWGDTQYDDLILVRGANKENEALYDWRKTVEQGKMEDARKNIAVIITNEVGDSVLRFEFSKAWIKEYQPPTLNSHAGGGQANLATEQYVITFDEMDRKNV